MPEMLDMFYENKELFKNDRIVLIYYHTLNTLLTESTEHFKKACELFITSDEIPVKEKRGVFFHLQNFIVLLMYRSQVMPYLNDMMNVYEFIFETGILDKDIISHHDIMVNYTILCINTEKENQAKQYIEKYAGLIKSAGNNLYHLCLAMLYVSENETEKAMKLLKKMEPDSLDEYIAQKIEFLKIYFEEKKIDEFYSLSHTLMQNLKRNIELAKEYRLQYCLNFVNQINELFELALNYASYKNSENKNKIIKFQETLQESKTGIDPWLLKKIKKLWA
jgi:hypothetical protein